MAILRCWHRHAVNTVIGDESFIRTFGIKPDARTDETLRVRTHLAYVERLLREKPTPHLMEPERQTRLAMLDLLRQYWVAGAFPSNTNPEYGGTRRPCFIDACGTICAVGYLIEQTAGREVAESVNRQWQSAFVSQMISPSVEEWVARSGLTVEEVALIQPGYWGDDEDEEFPPHREPQRDKDEEYWHYVARQRGLVQPTREYSSLEKLEERIQFLEQAYEQALVRSNYSIASMARVELVGLKEERARLS